MLVLTGVVSAGTLVNGFTGYLNEFLAAGDAVTITLLVLALGCVAAWDIEASATDH